MEAWSLPRPYSDSGATGSGLQFLFHPPDVNTTTSRHVTAPCGCTVSTSDRSAAVSRTSLTVLQVLSLAGDAIYSSRIVYMGCLR